MGPLPGHVKGILHFSLQDCPTTFFLRGWGEGGRAKLRCGRGMVQARGAGGQPQKASVPEAAFVSQVWPAGGGSGGGGAGSSSGAASCTKGWPVSKAWWARANSWPR